MEIRTATVLSTPLGEGSTASKILVALTVVLVLCAATPSLFLQFDRWDGSIIADALRTGNLRGVEVWFNESHGQLTLALIRGLALLHSNGVAMLPGTLGFAGIVFGSVGIYLAAQALFNNGTSSAAAAVVFASSPLAILNSSSILAFTNIALGLGLTGLYLSTRSRLWAQGVGLVLMVLSLQLFSMLPLLCAMIVFCVLQRWLDTRRVPLTTLLALVVLPSAYLVLFAWLFQIGGAYQDYNVFGLADVANIPSSFFSSTFWSSLGIQALVVWLILSLTAALTCLVSSRGWKNCLLAMVGLPGLYLVACLPYLLVRKAPPPYPSPIDALSSQGRTLFEFTSWEYRHLTLAMGVVALTLGWGFTAARANRLAILPALLLLALTIATNAAFSIPAWSAMFERDGEEAALATEWSSQQWPTNAICAVDLSRYPAYAESKPQFYELQYLAAFTGKPRSTIIIRQSAPQSEPSAALDLVCHSEEYAVKYGVPAIDCTRIVRPAVDLPVC